MAKFIINSLKFNTSSCNRSNPFSDIPEDHTFYEHITFMRCMNISSGYSNNTYRPDQNITRGEITKLIVKALEVKHNSDISRTYTLDRDISWYYDDLTEDNVFSEYIKSLAMIDLDIMQVNGDYSPPPPFNPEEIITRRDLARIIFISNRWDPN